MEDFVRLTPGIKYAVGIDYGHGECSAAFCEIGWGMANQALNRPTDIRLYGNDKVTIPSAYCITSEGKMFVGRSALSQIRGASKFKISFKKRPSEMDGDELQTYSKYLGVVHKYVIDRSRVLAPGNYVVYLSSPSGWEARDRDIFRQAALSAGLPVAGLWAESRAGLFSNMENQEESERALMREGCILADIGSSTIDFSYLNDSLKNPITDYGIQDGAQVLDMILYHYILSLPGNEKAKELVGKEGMGWLKHVLVYECRRAKEEFFSSESPVALRCKYDFAEVFHDIPELSKAEFRCNKENGGLAETIMGLFTGGLSSVGLSAEPDDDFAGVDWDAVNEGFFPTFAHRLQSFVEDFVKDNPVRIILLSGGASYMFLNDQGLAFFRESILRPTFPNSDVRVGFDGKPSTSVSRGVCSLGRANARFLGCEGTSDAPEYESFLTKIGKVLDYQTAVMAEAGTAPAGKEDPLREERWARLPYSEAAAAFMKAVTNTPLKPLPDAGFEKRKKGAESSGNTESFIYDQDLLSHRLPVLKMTVCSDHPVPGLASRDIQEEYKDFLSKGVAACKPARRIVAEAIASTAMPITREYILSFDGDTLQDLRDGLAQVLKDRYKEISDAAFSAAKDYLRGNLDVERTYVTDLISRYTACIQKDLMLDSDRLGDVLRFPSVDELLEQVDVYGAIDAVASLLLSLLMIVINIVVITVLGGIPHLISYVIHSWKEHNWSFDDYMDYAVDKFMFVDFSQVRLFDVGRFTIRQGFQLGYEKSRRKMAENICRSFESKKFDDSIIAVFSSAAKITNEKYIEVVNTLFS